MPFGINLVKNSEYLIRLSRIMCMGDVFFDPFSIHNKTFVSIYDIVMRTCDKVIVTSNLTPAMSVSVDKINQKIDRELREFYKNAQCIQNLDSHNDLSYEMQCRSVSFIYPGTLNKITAGVDIRSIQPSFFNILCPITNTESSSIGLVNHLSKKAFVNDIGMIGSS